MRYPYEPPQMSFKDYRKFLEWQEARDEARAKKKEESAKKEREKKREGRAFTFAEGIIIAYLAQFIIGPLYTHYLQTLGLH